MIWHTRVAHITINVWLYNFYWIGRSSCYGLNMQWNRGVALADIKSQYHATDLYCNRLYWGQTCIAFQWNGVHLQRLLVVREVRYESKGFRHDPYSIMVWKPDAEPNVRYQSYLVPQLVVLVLIHLLDVATVCSDRKLAQYSRHTMRYTPI